MRYWAYFAAKLVVAAVAVRGLLKLVVSAFPASKDPYAPLGQGLNFLLCDLALMVVFLIAAGALSGTGAAFLADKMPIIAIVLAIAAAIVFAVAARRKTRTSGCGDSRSTGSGGGCGCTPSHV